MDLDPLYELRNKLEIKRQYHVGQAERFESMWELVDARIESLEDRACEEVDDDD